MAASRFNSLSVAQCPETIFSLTNICSNDVSTEKVNLLFGVYRTDEGKTCLLPVVSKVEKQLANDVTLDKGYGPVLGHEPFIKAAVRLLLGTDSPSVNQGRAFGMQCVSGCGALRVAAEFLAHISNFTVVYSSNPTWENYKLIFTSSGFQTYRTYRYLDDAKKGLDFEGMMEDLRNAPENSVIILQACAHNPTGVDPTKEQWQKIANLMQERKLFPVFDVAYQGFVSGDVDEDAWAVRYFESRGFEMICAQTFSKSFTIYNERLGNLTFIVNDKAVIEPLRSHCFLLARGNYSDPPSHGAKIVAAILEDPLLTEEWKSQLKEMSERTVRMRHGLKERLDRLGTPGSWNHITDQIGMFCYSGIDGWAAEKLMNQYHIYLMTDGGGRINMSGLNSRNIDYVANCIHKVLTEPRDL